MKYFALILCSFLSSLVHAGNCSAEIKKAIPEVTLAQIIKLVEKEGESYDAFAQVLRSLGTVVDFSQDKQFYHANSQFNRKTAYFNGSVPDGKFFGMHFSGTLSPSSPFGLFIGFDINSCKLRSVSYDFPLSSR